MLRRAPRTRDEARTRSLEAIGVTVVRFDNEEVLRDLAGVLSTIRAGVAEAARRSRRS